jgi:hypothetical protein
MPTFYPEVEDMDIDPDEYYELCSDSEKKKLVEYLIDDDFISKREYTLGEDINVCPTDLDNALKKLYGKSHCLTKDEEDFIINISKKF